VIVVENNSDPIAHEPTRSSPDPDPWGTNPYSLSAIAERLADVTERGQDVRITVPTSALRSASEHVRGFLSTLRAPAERTPPDGRGRVITVTGEAGMGKTHLLTELMAAATRDNEDAARPGVLSIYVEARKAIDPWQALYKRFMESLPLTVVREHVDRIYTEIVAADLAQSKMTERIAQSLRGGHSRPDAIVQQFSLPTSLYEQRLLETLGERLANPDFALVFSLLRQDHLHDMVGAWLSGFAPTQALQDRGIVEQINTERAALEALTVFTRLFGNEEEGFLLVIDEADKLIPHRALNDSWTSAFRDLLRVFRQTRSLLVLAGLPELYEFLPEDIKQRVGPTISMPALSLPEVREYVLDVHEAYFHERTIAPFTDAALEAIVDAARGVPRMIIRLCGHSFQRHLLEGTAITRDLVADVAREHIGPESADSIREHVAVLLHAIGLDFRPDYLIGEDENSRVDYWIFEPDAPERGMGLSVAGPVLELVDLPQFDALELAVGESEPRIQVLVVVNGRLSSSLQGALRRKLGIPPLVYQRRTFEGSLRAALKGTFGLLAPADQEQPDSLLQQQVVQIDRKQTLAYDYLLQLSRHVDAIRTSSESRLDALKLEIQRMGRGPAGTEDDTGEIEVVGTRQRLPTRVAQLFRDALDSVADVSRVRPLLNETFTAAAQPGPGEHASLTAVRAALRRPGVTAALGVVQVLSSLIQLFQESVSDWFDRTASGVSDADDPDELRRMCRNFDSIYEYLPLSQLDYLRELANLRFDRDDPISGMLRYSDRPDLREILDGFGEEVFREMRSPG
jgi:type II secretory pathway predicted ATPase ExeA